MRILSNMQLMLPAIQELPGRWRNAYPLQLGLHDSLHMLSCTGIPARFSNQTSHLIDMKSVSRADSRSSILQFTYRVMKTPMYTKRFIIAISLIAVAVYLIWLRKPLLKLACDRNMRYETEIFSMNNYETYRQCLKQILPF